MLVRLMSNTFDYLLNILTSILNVRQLTHLELLWNMATCRKINGKTMDKEIELHEHETVIVEDDFTTALIQQRRESSKKRAAALRKGRRERAELATESTTWQPEIKPYRRGS